MENGEEGTLEIDLSAVCPVCLGIGRIDMRGWKIGIKREDYNWMVCFSCGGSGARKECEDYDA